MRKGCDTCNRNRGKRGCDVICRKAEATTGFISFHEVIRPYIEDGCKDWVKFRAAAPYIHPETIL